MVRLRSLLLELLPLAAVGIGACTTSTAVLVWHDGWVAERAGDLEKAERKYTVATELDPGLVGAECNRIRLLAAHPDRQSQAQQALEKLMKTKAATPEVAATGAFAALSAGTLDVAQKRLAAARKLQPTDAIDVHQAVAAATVLAHAAAGNWTQSLAASAATTLAEDATAARQSAAIAAWNLGDLPAAEAVAPRDSELGVWLAVASGQHGLAVQRANALTQSTKSGQLHAISAWARAQSGDLAGARGDLALAAKADQGSALVAQVTAGLALLDGQAAQARDVLAGIVARTPSAPWSVWFDLGVAQVQTGEVSAAQASFSRAAQLCSQCPSAVRNRDLLARLSAGSNH